MLDNAGVLTNAGSLAAIDELIAGAPATLRITILSRCELPLRLGRHRAQGQVREIAASDLRFSEPEAPRSLRKQVTTTIEPDEIRRIWSASEGWITGIYLAGISRRRASIAGQGDDDRSIVHGEFLDEHV